MLEGWQSGLRLFGRGMVVLLLLGVIALGLRKDPLGGLDLTDREWAEPAPVPEPVAVAPDPAPNMARGPVPGRPGAGLPAAVQSRVERITESEILGPVMRPLPMALLGIAGEDAFLRAPNGQSGLMRVGDELGGVRLLRIGTNRVLIEHDKEQKELTLYSGIGGESLLPGAAAEPAVETPVAAGQR